MSRPVDDEATEPVRAAERGAGTHDIEKGAKRLVLPASRFGLVYGTITVGAVLGAESARAETYARTFEGVLVVIVLFWLAHGYAAYTAHRMEFSEPLSLGGFARAMVHELTVVLGAAVPLGVLVIMWLFDVALRDAITVGVWTSAAVIAVIEISIAVRGELRGRELVAQIGFGVVLALLVIALNSIIH